MRRNFLLLPLLLLSAPSQSQSDGRAGIMDPLQALKAANAAVQIMEKMTAQKLDYSEKSLQTVDDFLLRLRAEGTSIEKVFTLLTFFGCYVGEVICRNLEFQWKPHSEADVRMGFPYLLVKNSTGISANPIGKVMKLYENGEEDRTYGLYMLTLNRVRENVRR